MTTLKDFSYPAITKLFVKSFPFPVDFPHISNTAQQDNEYLLDKRIISDYMDWLEAKKG